MINNADWLLKLNYVSFLREVGRHFSVNRMLSFDSVKLRLDRQQSLSFLEFNYMIMQGYDFVEINRRYNCILQMGGSDQWGNIINGVELSHRMGGPQLYALTTPLLTTSSGAKMGKSAKGAVWLNGDLFSLRFLAHFEYRGRGCRPLLKVFRGCPRRNRATEAPAVPNHELKIPPPKPPLWFMARLRTPRQKPRARQREGTVGGDLPTLEISRAELDAGAPALGLFVKAGLVASNGEARRQIKGGGLRINDAPVTDEKISLTLKDLTSEGVVKLSMGRKKHVLLKPV